MIIWEYRTAILSWKPAPNTGDQANLNQVLAAAGREGWELAQTETTVTGGGYTSNLILIFKRPIPEAHVAPPPLPNK